MIFLSLKTALEITAEDAEDAENADEEGLRWPALPLVAFTLKAGMDGPRNTRKGAKGTGSEIDAIHPSGESGSFCKRRNFRAFRGLHCRI